MPRGQDVAQFSAVGGAGREIQPVEKSECGRRFQVAVDGVETPPQSTEQGGVQGGQL
ncbi:hypothetical protein [Streptomyces flaveolus]|uniref:hypothetical protein n=1 Tax=Streptomyces flaveolus TaxID=67297 RepID=UPI003441D9A1